MKQTLLDGDEAALASGLRCSEEVRAVMRDDDAA
jgi:hypothetical protein